MLHELVFGAVRASKISQSACLRLIAELLRQVGGKGPERLISKFGSQGERDEIASLTGVAPRDGSRRQQHERRFMFIAQATNCRWQLLRARP